MALTVRRYIWKKGGGTYTKPRSLLALRLAAARRVVWGRGLYTVKEDGDVVGKDLQKPAAVKRFIRVVSNRDIGSTYRIVDAKGNVPIVARAVKVNVLPTDSTNGNRKADAYYNWVVSTFMRYRPSYAGSYVCRRIAGSSSPSQHSYGNAVDFFFDTLSHQDVVADAAVANAGKLGIEHVISRQRVWTKGEGWHTYSGEYHSHVHVDFDPNFSGSCEVRN